MRSKNSENIESRLRQVEVVGHQVYWKGFFHKFTDSGDAIVEDERGRITLVGAYMIVFMDKQKIIEKDIEDEYI